MFYYGPPNRNSGLSGSSLKITQKIVIDADIGQLVTWLIIVTPFWPHFGLGVPKVLFCIKHGKNKVELGKVKLYAFKPQPFPPYLLSQQGTSHVIFFFYHIGDSPYYFQMLAIMSLVN